MFYYCKTLLNLLLLIYYSKFKFIILKRKNIYILLL